MSLLARANSNQLKKNSSYLILIYMWKIFMQLESVQFIVKIKRYETWPQFSQPSIMFVIWYYKNSYVPNLFQVLWVFYTKLLYL